MFAQAWRAGEVEAGQFLKLPDDKVSGEAASCHEGCPPDSGCICTHKAETSPSDSLTACDSKPSHFERSLRSTSICGSRPTHSKRTSNEELTMLVIDKEEVARGDRLKAPQRKKRATSYR